MRILYIIFTGLLCFHTIEAQKALDTKPKRDFDRVYDLAFATPDSMCFHDFLIREFQGLEFNYNGYAYANVNEQLIRFESRVTNFVTPTTCNLGFHLIDSKKRITGAIIIGSIPIEPGIYPLQHMAKQSKYSAIFLVYNGVSCNIQGVYYLDSKYDEVGNFIQVLEMTDDEYLKGRFKIAFKKVKDNTKDQSLPDTMVFENGFYYSGTLN